MSVAVLVADDEAPARAELVALLAADPRVAEVHAAASGAEALRILDTVDVAVAFLDIHMPGLSGFDLARALARLRERPAVVFVTADDAGAVEAFDVEAVDFVLKPVRAERLSRSLGRALAAGAGAGAGADADDDETIAVTVGSTTRLVRRAEIRWVQASGDYSRLYTPTCDHLVRLPLSDLADRWAHAGFVRVHRSYLVHRDAIVEVRLSGTAPSVVLAEIELPVSRRLVPSVRDALLR
ncbi:LytR family transcriptional regulator [Microbacterium testaceum]|uniref:LytR/AlgR family response regulator transcription factor n=1 Tax=Microbacterium testaceum TaxID=2033 RepID=UPI000733FCFE|nr:LytTR family DNA-binding domain-containing protein [Microbacterium testaceum]KTS86195.1 LytR family transcriptional regulator [Microbacterium testaceum]